ncbi:dTDP-rha:a-D-glcnac-diphosphoryl polyprenol%2C a-3-L-rhamnosyl transferase wbbL1 [Mycobacterium tuberculosis]|nr:dTDP-rha:a-D-glcnac-diphosphoryl polyprenol%2C a-3-L-rhamnosyl transferase wbbL1 [Mycobacterium tuberculosis]
MTDVLPVVAVTYSPGPHLERFLASLSLATERPVSVLLADNGSTDGTPQAAVQRYPNVRLLPTGANLGYGTAVNRTIAQLGEMAGDAGEPWVDDWVIVANPDVQWGPGSIDALLDAASRWPRAGALGPLIRDPDGSVYPSARQMPSLIRGGMHAVLGPFWPSNPWTTAYRQERLGPVNGRWVGCRGLAYWCAGRRLARSADSTNVTSCTWRTSTLATGLAKPVGCRCMCRQPRFCTTRRIRRVATRQAIWPPITKAPISS